MLRAIIKFKETGEKPAWAHYTADKEDTYYKETVHFLAPHAFDELVEELGGIDRTVANSAVYEYGFNNVVVFDFIFASKTRTTDYERQMKAIKNLEHSVFVRGVEITEMKAELKVLQKEFKAGEEAK